MRRALDWVVAWVGPDEGWATWVLLLAAVVAALAVGAWVVSE